MGDSSKAEPTNTTLFKVMAQSYQEALFYLEEVMINHPQEDLDQLQELLMCWYLKGIAAGQATKE